MIQDSLAKTDASVARSVSATLGFNLPWQNLFRVFGRAAKCQHSNYAASCDRAACRLYEHCRLR